MVYPQGLARFFGEYDDFLTRCGFGVSYSQVRHTFVVSPIPPVGTKEGEPMIVLQKIRIDSSNS